MKKTITKRLITLLLTLCLLLYCFSSFSVVAENENTTIRPAAGDVYYITDTTTIGTYLSTINSYSTRINVGHCSDRTAFWNYVESWSFPNISDFDLIQDSYIIFEVTQGFDPNTLYGGKSETEILEWLFSELKENGCYIMFICNVDETRFFYETNFLNNVDIHINTDMLTVFSSNIIAAAKGGDITADMNNCTFIIDKNSSETLYNPLSLKDEFYKLLFGFLKETYPVVGGGINDAQYWAYWEQNYGIKAYCCVDDYPDFYNCSVIDPQTNSYEIINQYLIVDNYSQSDYICAVASSIPDPLTMSSFFSGSRMLRNDLGKDENDFPFYLYNPDNYYLGSGITDIIEGGYGLASFPNKVQEIIEHFLSGYDVSHYDNWSGVCDVTRKPFSEDATGGWMMDLQLVVDAWQMQD